MPVVVAEKNEISPHDCDIPRRFGSTLSCVYFAFALLTAVYPLLRCFSHAELLYTEGWNVYNTQTWSLGKQLYPSHFGWTMVDYPALSFVVGSGLHRLTGHWLIPMRLLSFISTVACAVLSAFILRTLGVRNGVSWLCGAFTLALFCLSANSYVGVDDPQMFGESVFLFGLLIYLRRGEQLPSPTRVVTVALLFVIGGCVKHTPLEFPIAVFLDLLLLSLPLAGWYALSAVTGVAGAIVWHLHAAGPGFVHGLLLGREYSILKSLLTFRNVFGPLLFPFAIALWQALQLRRDAKGRTLALLFVAGLAVTFTFEGGSGVAINESFGLLLATALLTSLAMENGVARLRWSATSLTACLFAWLVIPAIVEDMWNPLKLLREQHVAEASFSRQLRLLRTTRGPVLCESLLLCQEAGKPYLYDPFNATRLVRNNRLPVEPLLQAIEKHQFALVQLRMLPPGDATTHERFPAAVTTALRNNYRPVSREATGFILKPSVTPKPALYQTCLKNYVLTPGPALGGVNSAADCASLNMWPIRSKQVRAFALLHYF